MTNKTAPCGHAIYGSNDHCAHMECDNYYMKCPNWGMLDHARRDLASRREAASTDVKTAILQMMSVTLQAAGADDTAVLQAPSGPVLQTRMWVNGVWSLVEVGVVTHKEII